MAECSTYDCVPVAAFRLAEVPVRCKADIVVASMIKAIMIIVVVMMMMTTMTIMLMLMSFTVFIPSAGTALTPCHWPTCP